LGIALEERQADDEMIQINELKIAYSPALYPYLTGKTIDYQRNFFGQWQYVVYGVSSCG